SVWAAVTICVILAATGITRVFVPTSLSVPASTSSSVPASSRPAHTSPTTTGAGQAKPHRPERYKPGQTVVSLTFDDAYENQWLYSVPLLRSHHMTATYYVITINENEARQCCMSYDQLDALQAEGNDIGGHGINHLNLTTSTRAQARHDVCGG